MARESQCQPNRRSALPLLLTRMAARNCCGIGVSRPATCSCFLLSSQLFSCPSVSTRSSLHRKGASMFAAALGSCIVLCALLAAPRQALAAPPETPTPAANREIHFDVVVAQFQSPLQFLIPPSLSLVPDRFPVPRFLDTAQGNYLNYLERLQKRNRLWILSRSRIVARSGSPATIVCDNAVGVPCPRGPGSVGLQFATFKVRADFRPVQLADDTIRLDAGTVVTIADDEETDRRHFRAVEIKPGQTLLVATSSAGCLLLVTPIIAQRASASPAGMPMRTRCSECVRDGFRCLVWRSQELQAEAEDRWDEMQVDNPFTYLSWKISHLER